MFWIKQTFLFTARKKRISFKLSVAKHDTVQIISICIFSDYYRITNYYIITGEYKMKDKIRDDMQPISNRLYRTYQQNDGKSTMI